MAVQTSIFHQASILGCGAGGCTTGNAGQMGTCTTSVARAADEGAALNICKLKKTDMDTNADRYFRIIKHHSGLRSKLEADIS